MYSNVQASRRVPVKPKLNKRDVLPRRAYMPAELKSKNVPAQTSTQSLLKKQQGADWSSNSSTSALKKLIKATQELMKCSEMTIGNSTEKSVNNEASRVTLLMDKP